MVQLHIYDFVLSPLSAFPTDADRETQWEERKRIEGGIFGLRTPSSPPLRTRAGAWAVLVTALAVLFVL